MARYMQRQGHKCGRHRVRRLMRLMRLVPIYQTPNTSRKHPQHKIYPYLLRGLKIERPNHVWCTDITYIPPLGDCLQSPAGQWMRRGFLYLVAIMDWATRKVLAWRLSNTMEAEFCAEALEDALAKYGPPEIFNTDQGSQFTSDDFTQVLKDAKVKISPLTHVNMRCRAVHGRAGSLAPLIDCYAINCRATDNRMIERLWPLSWFASKPLPCNGSLKYECVYIRAFETGGEALREIGKWLTYYNTERPHSRHGMLTPNEAYERKTEPRRQAA